MKMSPMKLWSKAFLAIISSVAQDVFKDLKEI